MTAPAPVRRLLTGRLVSALVLALAVSFLALAPGAHAAGVAPTNLRGESNAGVVPTFSWDAAADAVRFEVQVASDPGFQQRVVDEGTVNTSYVPRAALPAGTLYWRVRSVDSSGVATDYASSTYVQAALPGPGLTSPADAAAIAPPEGSVKLTWDPVPGASQYEVQISRDNRFTSPEYRAEPRAAAYVLSQLPVTGTWYWRVQGRIQGASAVVNTEWSATRSFTYGQLGAATRVSPAEDAVVQDSVLSWAPVPGATSYDVQISTDVNFQANSLVHARNNITGTTYARPATLDNDQYFWRVRARDANDNVQDWSRAAIWRFERAWPDQPHLSYPADQARVGDPLYFEWTPIAHASRYKLQLANDASFNSIYQACTTTATTYTPIENGDCMPASEGTYYWRVLAYDDLGQPSPQTTDTLCPVGAVGCQSIEVRRFTYAPAHVTPTAPAPGTTVQVPTLEWNPVPGVARYRVVITSTTSSDQVVDVTAATSYTPRNRALPAGTYRWDVITLTEDGRSGASTSANDQPRFTVEDPPDPTGARPDAVSPLDGSFQRFPTLTWTPTAGAEFYRVSIRRTGTLAWDPALDATFFYAAGQDVSSNYLAADSYDWKVDAFDINGIPLQAVGSIGHFTIAAPAPVDGYTVALTNAGLGRGETCSASLPAECQNLRQTPVLSWAPAPNIGYYKLYIARDRNLTNVYRSYNGLRVMTTRWSPSEQFEDSQAGSAYYWSVVACTAGGACGPKTAATHVFNKKSNPVQVVSPGVEKPQGSMPAQVPTVADAVTLRWDDYLASNTTAAKGDTVLATKATLEARHYRVQVSQDENFQTVLDDQEVDQTQYTAFDKTYPEGPLFWRVQAFDGTGLQLSWSPTYVFRKVSPTPTPTSPADGGRVSGSVTLGWQALASARSYDVEIYRNADRNASPSNLVASGSTVQVAWAPADVLPVSDQAYVWRVRRRDAGNREGAWSGWQSFTVDPAVPELVSPAPGTRIHPTRTTFTWRGVNSAARYAWQWRMVGDPSRGAQAETQGLAFAPITNLPDGTLEWRVLPLDARGEITVRPADRDALWRRFTVGNAPQVVATPRISGSPQVGAVLTSTAPTWVETGVRTSYQWLRDGSAIPGATATSYQTVRDDLGRQVSLRVYGDLPGFSQASTTSNALQITSGPAPTLAGSFLVSGTGRVGTSLSGTAPAWNETDVTTVMRWLADGQEVADGAAPLALGPQLVGKVITLRAVGRRDGYSDAVVVSNPVTVIAGDAPVALSPVAVVGTPRAGEALSVSGSWSNQPQLSYQWLVDGAPIPGETGGSYRVRATDAARTISATVIARREGFDPGTATTAGVVVAKLASTTEISLSATTATRKTVKKVKAVVVVRVPDVAGPLGTIKVYDGKKVVKTITLTASRKGQVSVKVGKLKKGKHKIRAVYAGTTSVTGSTSPVVKLVVSK